jgi:hypothetical protein
VERSKGPPLAGYTTLVVRNLGDAVEKRPTGDDAAAYAEDVKAGGQRFAEDLIEKLNRDEKNRRAIVREPPEGEYAVITGHITAFRDGNLATRYVGIGGRDRFSALVEVRDGRSDRLLGTIEVDMAGSFIPGLTNLIQTTNTFINGAAARVRDEVLIAVGDKRRVDTGREGRLREKYNSSR